MSLLEKVRHHWPRLKHSLGQDLKLGSRRYKLRGYHPDGLARDFDDEPHMLPVLERVFKERAGAIVDVGANCGQTLIKALAVDPGRDYFGFEPQLACCFYIEHFIRSNALNNARIIPLAMSNVNGMVELFRDHPNDPTASILASHAQGAKRQLSSWVPARRGDELVQELGIVEIATIKIDVEGFELEVMSGLRETIAKHRPLILFEVLTNYVWGELIQDEAIRCDKQHRANSIFALLSELQYAVHRIDRAGAEHRIEQFELDERPGGLFSNEGRDYLARCAVR